MEVCYCPGFDADGGIGTEGVVTTCHTEAAEDFPQTIGTIVLIFGEIMRGERVTEGVKALLVIVW